MSLRDSQEGPADQCRFILLNPTSAREYSPIGELRAALRTILNREPTNVTVNIRLTRRLHSSVASRHLWNPVRLARSGFYLGCAYTASGQRISPSSVSRYATSRIGHIVASTSRWIHRDDWRCSSQGTSTESQRRSGIHESYDSLQRGDGGASAGRIHEEVARREKWNAG